MKIKGNYILTSPPEEIWRCIMEPEILSMVIPGCERIEKDGSDQFILSIRLRLGKISPSVACRVQVMEKNFPSSYGLLVQGMGRIGSIARARGKVTLERVPESGGTILAFSGDGMIGGWIMRLGRKYLDRQTEELTKSFFVSLDKEAVRRTKDNPRSLTPEHKTDSHTDEDRQDSTAAKARPGKNIAPTTGGMPAWLWVPAFITVMGLILAGFAQ